MRGGPIGRAKNLRGNDCRAVMLSGQPWSSLFFLFSSSFFRGGVAHRRIGARDGSMDRWEVPKAWLAKLDGLVKAAGGKPFDSENRRFGGGQWLSAAFVCCECFKAMPKLELPMPIGKGNHRSTTKRTKPWLFKSCHGCVPFIWGAVEAPDNSAEQRSKIVGKNQTLVPLLIRNPKLLPFHLLPFEFSLHLWIGTPRGSSSSGLRGASTRP